MTFLHLKGSFNTRVPWVLFALICLGKINSNGSARLPSEVLLGYESVHSDKHTFDLDDNECPDIILSYSKTDVSCIGPVGGSVILNVSGGRPPYSYLWSNGATSKDVANLVSGIYSVVVSDQDGCEVSESIQVLEGGELGIIASVTQEQCTVKGAIDLTVSGGTPPYSYLWSNGATTEDVSDLEAGEYRVQISDSKGCRSTHHIEVTSDLPFDVKVFYTNITTPQANDGIATVQTGNQCTPPDTTTEDCGSCTSFIAIDNGAIVVNNGQKVCLTASSFNSVITVTGGELVICGNAVPASFNFSGGKVTVIGELEIPNTTTIGIEQILDNYGTVTSQAVHVSGLFRNHGNFTLTTGNLHIQSGGTVVNTNTLSIRMGGIGNNGELSNSGRLTVVKNIELRQNGLLINSCTIKADTVYCIEGFTNYGSILASVIEVHNDDVEIELGGGSSIYAQKAELKGTITNDGNTCALVKATSMLWISPDAVVTGNINFCSSDCICELPSGSCSVVWSNSETGNTITGLSAGTYIASVTCGSCTVMRTVTLRAGGSLVINTEHVNEAEYTIYVPGVGPVQGHSGISASELILEPLLPPSGHKEKAMLTIGVGEDRSQLEIEVEYDHTPVITAVRAKMDNQYMDISQEYYTIENGNKLYFHNEKPAEEPYVVTTNLINGLKLDPASETLEIDLPGTSVFSSVLMGINKIEEGTPVQVVAPGSTLTWNASGAATGLYEFTLQLSDPQTTRTYKGQFIIE